MPTEAALAIVGSPCAKRRASHADVSLARIGTFGRTLAFERMMQYRGIEYAVIEGVERGVWKWSASVAGVLIVGHEPSKSAAVAAAEKAIDRAFRQKGTAQPN
jgi:hypothetical protein